MRQNRELRGCISMQESAREQAYETEFYEDMPSRDHACILKKRSELKAFSDIAHRSGCERIAGYRLFAAGVQAFNDMNHFTFKDTEARPRQSN